MKKHRLYFLILALIVNTVFSGCDVLAELAHGPKPELESPPVTYETTYTVTYNINEGSGEAPAAQTAISGSSITLHSGDGLSLSGYTFGGWNTDASGTGTNYSAGSSYTVTGDVTLYAKWDVITYTVTFDINSGSGTTPSAQTVSLGSSITLPSGDGLSLNGYTFGGWNTDASGTGTNYSAGSSYTVTSDVTLYAKWADASTVWTVRFETNGGSPVGDAVVLKNTAVSRPSPDTTKTGYTFDGWYTNTGLTVPYNFSSIVTGNITLHAKWNIASYTVNFNANNATSGTAPSAQTVTFGSSITLPSGSDLSRTDYNFGGWSANADGTGTTYTAGSSYTVNGNITLYAVWQPTVVPGANLAAKLNWLQTNALSGGNYTVDVTANESINPATLSYSERTNIGITLKGMVTVRTVSLSSNGSMFTVENGVTLVLDNNITLQGQSNNTAPLVMVNAGGTLLMNAGSRITGNGTSSNSYYTGGGVSVSTNGTFTMIGGEISGNTSSYGGGGGVFVSSGAFTMIGGEISGNTSSYGDGGGGGVYVSFGAFTMGGGTISGNTVTTGRGGGVYVSSGTFTMSGGTISGNTVTTSSNYINGGGVYVYLFGGNFTKTGGTIYGYSTSDTVNSNVVKDGSGTVLSDRGHAVYASTNSVTKRRETTAGTGVNLSLNNDGTFSGAWEN